MSEKTNLSESQSEFSQGDSSTQEEQIEYSFKYVLIGLIVIGAILIGGLLLGISFIDGGLIDDSPPRDNPDDTDDPVTPDPPEEQVYEGYIEVIVYDESNLSEYPANAVTIIINGESYTNGETIPIDFSDRNVSKFIEYTVEVNDEKITKQSEVTEGDKLTIEVFV